MLQALDMFFVESKGCLLMLLGFPVRSSCLKTTYRVVRVPGTIDNL